MASIEGMPLKELIQLAQIEHEKFLRKQPNDPGYAFELFRRALAEEDPEAFAGIVNIYERLILKWIYNDSSYSRTNEPAEHFLWSALSAVYQALRGRKFDNFTSLQALMSYIKISVHTQIMQHLRANAQQPSSLDLVPDQRYEPDLIVPIMHEKVMQRIRELLPDHNDYQLALYRFVYDWPPRKILQAGLGSWPSERAITVAIYRIRGQLRRDALLRKLLALDDDTAAKEPADRPAAPDVPEPPGSSSSEDDPGDAQRPPDQRERGDDSGSV